jgi:hypothetical protein
MCSLCGIFSNAVVLAVNSACLVGDPRIVFAAMLSVAHHFNRDEKEKHVVTLSYSGTPKGTLEPTLDFVFNTEV